MNKQTQKALYSLAILIILGGIIMLVTPKGAKEVAVGTAFIKQQAQIMGDALVRKDYETFSRYLHPKIATLAGGKQNVIDGLEKTLSDGGITIKRLTIGEPSKILTVGTELQSSVPTTAESEITEGTVQTQGTMIAVSPDKGKTWYFIEVPNSNLATLRKVLPNISADLPVSPYQEPVLYKN